MANRRKFSNCTSVYKGVVKTGPKTWVTRMLVGKKFTYVGSFRSEEEAARAYARIALAQYGPFARLNFPLQQKA